MKRHEAIKIISQLFKTDDLVISSTGNLSRELSIIDDSDQNFYMMGSMGLASSIGLGLAICLPDKRIIVIEGDGSVLMNMGSMATIGHYKPSNFLHIVLDNEMYDSTGGQPSASNSANLQKVAGIVGYRLFIEVSTEKELKEFLEVNIETSLMGPVFIQVKVEPGGLQDRIPRVPYEPENITSRFKKYIKVAKKESV